MIVRNERYAYELSGVSTNSFGTVSPVNDTIVGNTLGAIGIVENAAATGLLTGLSNILGLVQSSIVWHNGGDLQVGTADTVIRDIVLSTAHFTNWEAHPDANGVTILATLPLFDLVAADYSITAGSPCVDAGNPNNDLLTQVIDIAGNPRLVDGDGDTTIRVDMGAYESQP